MAASLEREDLLTKVDIEAAYRHIPMHPQDHHLQAIRFNDEGAKRHGAVDYEGHTKTKYATTIKVILVLTEVLIFYCVTYWTLTAEIIGVNNTHTDN